MYYIKKDGIEKIGDSNCDVAIISPSLYWYVNKNFPFDNKRKIKNIILKNAKSSLPNANNVFIYKNSDNYLGFAYDKKNLTKIFEKSNLKIEKLFFSTTLFKNNKTDLKIKDKLFLNALGDTFYESEKPLNENIVSLNMVNFINLKYEKIIKSDNSNLFLILLILIVLSFFSNIISWSDSFQEIEEKSKKITIDGYSSSALIKKYQNIEKIQNEIRQNLVKVDSYNTITCKGIICESK